MITEGTSPDDKGPIAHVVKKSFRAMTYLTAQYFLSFMWHELKPRRTIAANQVDDARFTARRLRRIDQYIICWVVFELLAFTVAIGASLKGGGFRWLVLFLAAWRIFDILQATINTTLFDGMSERTDLRVASLERAFVLATVNYVELAICFGLIYAMNADQLRDGSDISAPITGFYFSLVTQLTIGYGDVRPVEWLRLVAVVQGIAGVAMIVLVIGRLMASLAPMNGIRSSNSSSTNSKTDRSGEI